MPAGSNGAYSAKTSFNISSRSWIFSENVTAYYASLFLMKV
jgi:hypothetical protein